MALDRVKYYHIHMENVPATENNIEWAKVGTSRLNS